MPTINDVTYVIMLSVKGKYNGYRPLKDIDNNVLKYSDREEAIAQLKDSCDRNKRRGYIRSTSYDSKPGDYVCYDHKLGMIDHLYA